MTRPKRLTAAQRDERIVAEAGPWTGSIYDNGTTTRCEMRPNAVTRGMFMAADEALGALIRIANRITKARGR